MRWNVTLLDEVRADLGSVAAQPLALDATTRKWINSGAAFEASVQDVSVSETYSIGQSLDTEVITLYADYTSTGALPMTVKQRVRVEGKEWHVINAVRVPAVQAEAGVTYTLQRAS
jgi:hypothetical protein